MTIGANEAALAGHSDEVDVVLQQESILRTIRQIHTCIIITSCTWNALLMPPAAFVTIRTSAPIISEI